MTAPSTQASFRDARPEDIAAVVGLLADDALGQTREAFGDAVDSAYLKAFEAIRDDPNNRLIVVDLAGEVVGCMQLTTIPHLTFRGGTRLQIEGVRIKQGFRDRALGSAMISWAIDDARERGCHLVQLTSNKQRDDAARFYARLGFEPSHIGFKRYLT